MNSPLLSASSSTPAISVFVDPSSASAAALPGSVPLHLCRHRRSHLVRPSATDGCETPVVSTMLATGFGGGGGGGGVFVGSCFGDPVVPPTTDGSAFYAPPYVDGASFDGWHHSFAAAAAAAVGINGMSGGWATFDPRPIAAAAAGYACGPVGYGVDVRRKNATRESTSTLKAWLFDHIKNPYPTKGEKVMLAIITKMTLTQVSTWFANARRRLKKENKMQWPARQRPTDDGGDGDGDDSSLSDENDDVTGRARIDDVTADEGEANAAAAAGPSPARSDDDDDDDDDDVIVDTDCEGDEDRFSLASSSPNLHSRPTRASAFPGVEPNLLSRSGLNSLSPDERDRDTVSCDSHAVNVSLPAHPPLSPAEGGRDIRHVPSAFDRDLDLPSSLRNGDGGVKVKPRIWSLVDTATSGGHELYRPEVVSGRSKVAFPVGWEGVGERAFQSWMSTAFHPPVDPLLRNPSSAFPRSFYAARPKQCAESSYVCALASPPRGAPHHWSPWAVTFGALNDGGLDLRELELDRKRHLNAAADQSVDV